MAERPAVVCGGGGFVGGHLVARLHSEGWRVRAIDAWIHDQILNNRPCPTY